MAAPFVASCGTERFAEPQKKPLISTGKPKGWQVVYVYPRNAPSPRPGETTSVTLVEYGPAGALPVSKGAQVIDIAGRKVSFYDRTKTTAYVARWQTDKARYVALADGKSPATLKKVISCLP